MGMMTKLVYVRIRPELLALLKKVLHTRSEAETVRHLVFIALDLCKRDPVHVEIIFRSKPEKTKVVGIEMDDGLILKIKEKYGDVDMKRIIDDAFKKLDVRVVCCWK